MKSKAENVEAKEQSVTGGQKVFPSRLLCDYLGNTFFSLGSVR
jgi:hypothetical protein